MAQNAHINVQNVEKATNISFVQNANYPKQYITLINKIFDEINVNPKKHKEPFEIVEKKIMKTEGLIHYFIIVLESLKTTQAKEMAIFIENITKIHEIDKLNDEYVETKNPLYYHKLHKKIEPYRAFMKQTIYRFQNIFTEETVEMGISEGTI